MNCERCNRALKDRLHDKCVYCGCLIPEAYRLTDEERYAIRMRKQQVFDDIQKDDDKLKAQSEKTGAGSEPGATHLYLPF